MVEMVRRLVSDYVIPAIATSIYAVINPDVHHTSFLTSRLDPE